MLQFRRRETSWSTFMPRYRHRRASRKPERLPPAEGFARRLSALRALLGTDPGDAGDQALKLIEEYLQSLAASLGFRDEGSLRRYAMWLRGQQVLADDLLDRVELYTEARNCLAHTYGLQTSPAFAEELLDFAALLLKGSALTAGQLMTRDVRAVLAADPLARVRDIIVHQGYGRLPVLDSAGRLAGLLMERDVMVAQALAERTGGSLAHTTVRDALPPDALDRVVLVPPDAPRDDVVELLRRQGVVACLVTPTGASDERPVGIITHADLLYRM
jgi:CBS domain-containing protein